MNYEGSEHVQVLRSSAGWRAVDLRELWRARDLLVTLAARDVKLRYRQTVLGVVWVVLQPLLGAGVFSFIFGKVAKLPSDGVPYFVFAYAGLLGWNLFASTVNKSSGSLLGNAGMMSKIYFPRLILPLSTVFSSLIDFAVGLIMMVVLLVRTGTPVGLPLVALPLWVLVALAFALGIGMVASALQVSYRDVGQIMPVVLQFLLYASPVAYSVTAIPEHLRTVYSLNPLVGILEGFRWSLVSGADLDVWAAVYSCAFVVVLLVISALVFTRMERKFVDVI
jgi:lipopolysaccharide transport system permease protein